MRERAQNFRRSYTEISTQAFTNQDSGSLIHPGEYGGYRERLLETLLRAFLPNYSATGTGFAVSRFGKTSTQIDVVIYDSEELPKIEDPSLRRFFPIEGVLAAGEVKSKVRESELQGYLQKLMDIKRMALEPPANLIPTRPSSRIAEMVALQRSLASKNGKRASQKVIDRALAKSYDPYENNWQNKVTFLVCAEFEGGSDRLRQALLTQVGAVKSENEASMNHNMFLSLEDGYQTYSVNKRSHPYPRGWSDTLGLNYRGGMSFIQADDDCNHILAFVSDLCSCVSDAAVYPFRAGDYVNISREFIPWG